jgi:type II secretory ATPase GspE/PulE/Tfp pilus assembly ATPase PilB-like protein
MRRARGSVDIAKGKMVEKELDAMIDRRSRQKDPDEESERWKESVRRYNARRREEMRAAWCEHHQGQAARLRVALDEVLIAGHEEQAERYREQPEGPA